MNIFEILRILFGGLMGFFVVDVFEATHFFPNKMWISIGIAAFSVVMIVALFYFESEYKEDTDRYNLQD